MAHDPDCEVKFLDSLIVARAFENECVVVFVNCGGKAEEGWIGGSGVTVPFKGWVGKSVSRVSFVLPCLAASLTTSDEQKNNEEELFFVDLDLDILKVCWPTSLGHEPLLISPLAGRSRSVRYS